MFGPQTLALLISILALMIPIVAILLAHQRRMAEIVHQSARLPDASHEIAALRHEIRELKELVHQQAILFDNVQSRGSTDLGERLSGGQP